ncbi:MULTISPECIES: lipid IV(A) 3-deoxy-D-manno-octulosonic acid transferase [Brucella/Ochrobactrum group]|uniref:lipid IV(A) 3-deoxy-D-manno-octulosonic acid transferase n=1 Tax=Brucella/Ochrobactrum group TaxID=2826938 RepID=UPI001C0599D7|nr:lipid IV(A) 3-deoxy-D-manno-octulosonic acid transferase [Brucella sp. NBRC 12950]QWK79300.1 lipid IV(A) 3-deoxy-D-manno-octulosonic acid transferase [Ochrobactrum sp. BTU1]GLU28347.1 3-deoxy-D-manno-octulosonic acid transferase [Brucella sp. NBRC 12950]
MSAGWARSMLSAYRMLGSAAYPFIGPYISYRAARGKEERGRRGERYGKTSIARPQGPVIWAHAASVGESVAMAPLIESIAATGIKVVMTTGTVTSAKLVSDQLGQQVIHQYAPLDLQPAVNNFLNHWKPDLAIGCESEIWPATVLSLGARHIPQVLVNGRLSDRSFAAWQKRPELAEALFEKFAYVIAQSELDGDRFRALGARPVSVSGNLKVDTAPAAADPVALATFQRQIGGRRSWAAISTHDGEEEIAAEVHQMLKVRYPHLLTIIVPRHPNRAPEIEAMLSAKGLKVAARSRGDVIDAQTDVLLGDTIGEMGLYLQLTEIAFIGNSLTKEGGHNPLEPAMMGVAVLTGKNVQNFRESFQRLIKNGGARVVKDRNMLAGAINFLFNNPQHLRNMVNAGANTVADMRGALNRTLSSLEPFIQPLVLQAQLPVNRDEARFIHGGI